MKDCLIQYLRKKHFNGKETVAVPYAVMVAMKKDNKISFGFALCNKKDDFSKEKGKKIAMGRAEAYINRRGDIFIPNSMIDYARSFIARSKAYFQNSSVIEEFENL